MLAKNIKLPRESGGYQSELSEKVANATLNILG